MKLGWRVFIVVAALGCGLYLSRKPWQVYREQVAIANASEIDMKDAERERERLMKEKMKVANPLGREQIMREKGWLKPGETPIDK